MAGKFQVAAISSLGTRSLTGGVVVSIGIGVVVKDRRRHLSSRPSIPSSDAPPLPLDAALEILSRYRWGQVSAEPGTDSNLSRQACAHDSTRREAHLGYLAYSTGVPVHDLGAWGIMGPPLRRYMGRYPGPRPVEAQQRLPDITSRYFGREGHASAHVSTPKRPWLSLFTSGVRSVALLHKHLAEYAVLPLRTIPSRPLHAKPKSPVSLESSFFSPSCHNPRHLDPYYYCRLVRLWLGDARRAQPRDTSTTTSPSSTH